MITKQYEYTHRNKFIALDAKSIDDFIEIFEHHAELFKVWRDKGITYSHGTEDDYATFIAPNKEVADEYGFEEFNWCNEAESCKKDFPCENCPCYDN